jgi:MFS family permease
VGIISEMKKFWAKQKPNYKIMIARDSLTMFSGRRPLGRGIGGYESIFLSRLGASALQIGYVNGIQSLLSLLLAVPSGWFIDRSTDIRRIYFASFAMSLPAFLGLYLASDWRLYLAAMLIYTAAISVQFPSQLIIDIDSMDDTTRVSGLGFHRTITALAGVASPMLIALAINYFGGLSSADSIRPLFLLFFLADVVILFIVYRHLAPVTIEREKKKASPLNGIKAVLEAPVPLKLLLVSEISSVFVMLMVSPFRGIYQVDIKTATIIIFGWIGVAEPAIDIFLSIPLANLVDKYGRKKTAYIGHIFGILARLLLVATPISLPTLLIMVSVLGSLEGCLYVGMDAYSQEAITQQVRGSYMGLKNLIVGVIGIASPVIGGYIWKINPDLLFWVPVIQWSLIAFPILVILMEKYSLDGYIRAQ